MTTLNATEIRNRWSEYSEQVIREKPLFIKEARDYLFLASLDQLSVILDAYTFTASAYSEADGSVTLSLNEIDLAENADTETDARLALGKGLLEYAEEYLDEFKLWNGSPNRKKHLPYVLKALTLGDPAVIGKSILCRVGNN